MNKQGFSNYLKDRVATSTRSKYLRYIQVDKYITRLKGLPSFDIYSITSVSELDQIIKLLKGDPAYCEEDKKTRYHSSSGLKKYREYLCTLPQNADTVNTPILPLQVIYFGAPGSGKSHKVAEDLAGISRENIFRTTFHPDYDYASFVGCYKPIIASPSRQDLSFEELKSRIQEEATKNPEKTIGKFTIKYYRSIQKLRETPQREELRAEIQKYLQRDTDGKAQYAYMNLALALGEYLEKEGLWRDDSTITYAFTPQVFTNAYVRAWEHPKESVYLIIEEINRGNCAQIFGDLFQLLDRKEDGTSCYPIHADKDLADYLQRELSEDAKLGIEGGNLCLPSNLHIIATMNTSDQSLFPMDSAFKRRWDWEYVPINYKEAKSSGFEITIGEKSYLWIKFLEHINGKVWDLTKSEDKQMGNFFIKGNITEEVFKSKVMAYLWHEICKDEYGATNYFFCTEKGNKFSFNQLYNKDSSPSATELLQGFMTYLGVSAIGEESAGEENE
jgi:type II restriction-modification system restriction subunit